jgi:hypothetical protein
MPAKRELELDESQRRALEEIRDHHLKPYMRERASALLKIADGASVNWVAQHGLLKPRKYAQVLDWLTRYEQDGVAGLGIRPGRGRKPVFPPRGSDAAARVDVDPVEPFAS